MSTITYARMIIDGKCLLLPEDEVHDILPIGNVFTKEAVLEAGCAEHQQQKYPVYLIDSTLSPLDKCPEQRQLVVCFSAKKHLLGVACDMVTSSQFVSNYLFEKIPEMMRLPNSPIQALLYADDQLHYVTTAESLVDFLINQER